VTSDNPLYKGGSPNPNRLGFISLRRSSGGGASDEEIARAALIIGIPVRYVDSDGYEREIIAAAIEGGNGETAYVQCRAKDLGAGDGVDIDFHIHLRAADGQDLSWPIKSYNPYFGCDVAFFEWIDQSVVFIYREKHDTYACTVAQGAAPVFKTIADDWVINGRVLGYWDWQETRVSRLTLPALLPLEAISEEEARTQSVLPPKSW
jgi:hypothetical protein